jgi:hypothetical protein
LIFRTWERLADWADSQGITIEQAEAQREVKARIEREVLEEIKRLHETSPKYAYKEDSQEKVLNKYQVEVLALSATYQKGMRNTKALILDNGEPCSAEEFAGRYFHKHGFETLSLESSPFHALFGIFMWLLIQDPADPKVRIVGFGNRASYEAGTTDGVIWTSLPVDFGTPGYAKRRTRAIKRHFEHIKEEDLVWLFEYWEGHSSDFRQYLWAHREKDVEAARKLIDILPPAMIIDILRYLLGNYWGRYLGWPDLLLYQADRFFFVEVKSSGDRLSEDQKRWIRDNYRTLGLPFKLVKIHRAAIASAALNK